MFIDCNAPIPGNLKDYFNVISSPDTAQKIENVITALSLPVPDEGEFLQTREGGALLYLEDQGCVIRITHDNRYPYHENDLVLRPLAALNADHFRIHINPGLACPINHDDIEDIVAMLANDNIGFQDCFPENAGYLPYKTPEFPNGIPVVIDEPAVKTLTEEIAACFARPLDDKQRAAKASAQNVQDKLFKPLREAFHSAWAEQNKNGTPHNMVAFWRLCSAMKEQGLLTDSWNSTTDYRILKKKPVQISYNYAQRLRQVL